jgi:hypothetical protein
MLRRTFLQTFTTLLSGIALPEIPQTKWISNSWKILQISPVAGFQYYQGEALWPQLQEGQMLKLIREINNPYDNRAVRIDWQGYQLGYIPRMDNTAISQLLDHKEEMSALIIGLKKSNNPWERIEVEVKWRV